MNCASRRANEKAAKAHYERKAKAHYERAKMYMALSRFGAPPDARCYKCDAHGSDITFVEDRSKGPPERYLCMPCHRAKPPVSDPTHYNEEEKERRSQPRAPRVENETLRLKMSKEERDRVGIDAIAEGERATMARHAGNKERHEARNKEIQEKQTRIDANIANKEIQEKNTRIAANFAKFNSISSPPPDKGVGSGMSRYDVPVKNTAPLLNRALRYGADRSEYLGAS